MHSIKLNNIHTSRTACAMRDKGMNKGAATQCTERRPSPRAILAVAVRPTCTGRTPPAQAIQTLADGNAAALLVSMPRRLASQIAAASSEKVRLEQCFATIHSTKRHKDAQR